MNEELLEILFHHVMLMVHMKENNVMVLLDIVGALILQLVLKFSVLKNEAKLNVKI